MINLEGLRLLSRSVDVCNVSTARIWPSFLWIGVKTYPGQNVLQQKGQNVPICGVKTYPFSGQNVPMVGSKRNPEDSSIYPYISSIQLTYPTYNVLFFCICEMNVVNQQCGNPSGEVTGMCISLVSEEKNVLFIFNFGLLSLIYKKQMCYLYFYFGLLSLTNKKKNVLFIFNFGLLSLIL